MEQLGILDPK